MEIERKWLVEGWPSGCPLLFEQTMRQGYISVRPTVRIREEILTGQDPEYMLCFKSSGGLARKEIEFPIEEGRFRDLEDLIGLPLIPKLRRTYLLTDGSHLEVSLVDADSPNAFWYAEIEYETTEQALNWEPCSVGMEEYLCHEVTGQPGQSMGAYWTATRMRETEAISPGSSPQSKS